MEHKVAPIISRIFEKRLSQNERLIKNIEKYEWKKRKNKHEISSIRRNQPNRQKVKEV